MASVGEIVKGAVEYAINGASDVLNVFYWEVTAAGSDEDVLDLIEDWLENDWGPVWADFASENSNLIGFQADIVDVDGVTTRSLGSRLVPIQGLSNAVPDVGMVSGYLQADTANPRSRGRKFVTGHPDDSIDAGYFDVEAMGDLAGLLVAWLEVIDLITGLEMTPGVPSKVLQTFLQFVGDGHTSDVPAIQRRRKPNVGS
jgi:hypothetical protein